jgi:alpha-ketoglutarate-dependent taurine dioxygenase
MQYRIADTLSAPRQLGIKVAITEPIENLSADELIGIRKCILRHGLICLITPAKPNEISALAAISAIGSPVEVPEHYRTVAMNRYVNVVGNIDTAGNPSESSYRHSGFWHADGQYFPLKKRVFCNVMVPKVVNQTRTLFLDTLLLKQADLDRYSGLINAKISLVRIMSGEVIAAITKNVWQPHPLSGEINLLVPSDRGREEQELINSKDPAFKKPADIRNELSKDSSRMYAHSYTVGEVLIWDNLQLLHRAEGNASDVKGPRFIYRGHFDFTHRETEGAMV